MILKSRIIFTDNDREVLKVLKSNANIERVAINPEWIYSEKTGFCTYNKEWMEHFLSRPNEYRGDKYLNQAVKSYILKNPGFIDSYTKNPEASEVGKSHLINLVTNDDEVRQAVANPGTAIGINLK